LHACFATDERDDGRNRHSRTPGLERFNPVGHVFLRGMGEGQGAGWGWPSSPKIEELRQQWLDAEDQADQLALSRDLQKQALIAATAGGCARGNLAGQAIRPV
jgi:hypothetical protein